MTNAAPSRAIILTGTEQPNVAGRSLKAGPLTAELENGGLRTIRFGGVEVLRTIAFLVRDENWGTFDPAIGDLKVSEAADGFTVTYKAVCSDAKRKIRYDARIAGKADGTLTFEAVATPETDFLTNRTGFVVLHPLKGVAGHTVKIEHVDGRKVTDKFPAIVDPVQPFKDIRALSHEAAPGLWATTRMEGDTFEMEDHRNWCDASYKTYVRPLALPWPYTLKKGESFTQSVSLSFSGPAPAAASAAAASGITVSLGQASGTKLPRIGLGLPAAEGAASLAAADLLKKAGAQLLIAEIDLREGHGRKELDTAKKLGETIGAAIVLEVVLPGQSDDPATELAPLAKALGESGLKPAAIAVSPAADLKAVLPGSKGPQVPPLETIYEAARKLFPGIALGGGMFSFFTELNRKRPPARLLDYVTHSSSPIVHAADDKSVMETLESLPYQIQSTRAFIAGKPYWVGPSAIGARNNPYGAASSPNPANQRVCLSQMDPRQRGLFGAAWNLGYIAAFAKGGIEVVSLGATTGSIGIVHRRTGAPQPFFDGQGQPAVFPVYHVIADLAAAAGEALVPTRSSDAGKVEALAAHGPGGTHLWVANLTAEKQMVTLADIPAGPAKLRMLDEASFVEAVTQPAWFATATQPLDLKAPLRLGAYAVARIDWSSR
ncbi:hypothetical protein FRZ61_43100 [Hypericibacter adhaerens]|jgi:hypothetical protein|uniref:Uncharacterized protein n=1 Tax=Hypericibacter adhaerens TaxID=2602016 RepID=A0A5J6N3K4_9PROT|nr:hypothetical protein [Hypericibacter adhaerens]QEX24369.1 hypothetical protein FRZ61_43100 [Hypericibacter adhaerens]